MQTKSHLNQQIKVGVFYDGNYFYHVNNYYDYSHRINSRINISGLHEFIRGQVEELFKQDNAYPQAQIVDSHYFRERLSAKDAFQKNNLLYYDRVFDDVLMSEGVTTHYLPIKMINGQKIDKGIDVWLSLEALENTYHKHYDVMIILASDRDYVPLIRKINAFGTRVVLVSWDFEYIDSYGHEKQTKTSHDLKKEVFYTVPMYDIIEDMYANNDPFLNKLFIPRATIPERSNNPVHLNIEYADLGDGYFQSEIINLKTGYGFIKHPENNLFFHHGSVANSKFFELMPGDPVRFRVSQNEDGQDIAVDVELIEFDEEELSASEE